MYFLNLGLTCIGLHITCRPILILIFYKYFQDARHQNRIIYSMENCYIGEVA